MNPGELFSRERRPILIVLLATGSLTTMTGTLVSPVFPDVVEALHVDPRWAGTLVSMHTLTIALFSPILGLLADRIGKLRVLIPALMFYAIFGASGAFATNYESLLLSRALLGIASAGIAAASIGFVGTMFEGEARSRMMGYTTSALATTSIVFPLVGGWLGSMQWQYAFGLYGMGFLVAIPALLILHEDRKTSTISLPAGQTQSLLKNLRQPAVMARLLALALASAIFYIVIIYAPLHFKASLGATAAQNGLILASRAIGAAIISAVGASRLAGRLGIGGAIATGFLLMAGTMIVIPFLTQVSLILPTALLFGIGYGIVMPNLYDGLAQASKMEFRTTILALGTGIASLGQFLSPVFLGPVWKEAGVAVFYLGTGLGVAMALVSLMGGKPTYWKS